MSASLPTGLWAAHVAAATPLPDARHNSRLERLLTQLAEKPLDGIPQASPDWHQAKATYPVVSLKPCGSEPGVSPRFARGADGQEHLPG